MLCSHANYVDTCKYVILVAKAKNKKDLISKHRALTVIIQKQHYGTLQATYGIVKIWQPSVQIWKSSIRIKILIHIISCDDALFMGLYASACNVKCAVFQSKHHQITNKKQMEYLTLLDHWFQ